MQAADQFSMASFYVEEQQVTYAAVDPATFRRYMPAATAQDERMLAALLAARVRQQTRTDAAVVACWDDGTTLMRVLSHDGGGAQA